VNVLGLRLLAIVALVLANAFFVAAELSRLVASRRTRIEAMARRGAAKGGRVVRKAPWRSVPAPFCDAARITLTSILLGYVAEDTVAPPVFGLVPGFAARARFLDPWRHRLRRAVGTISFLARGVRRTGAEDMGDSRTRKHRAAGSHHRFIIFRDHRPFNFVLNVSARVVLRLLGIKSSSPELDRVHSPERSACWSNRAARRAAWARATRVCWKACSSSAKRMRATLMTPRTQMVALPAEASLAEAADSPSRRRAGRAIR